MNTKLECEQLQYPCKAINAVITVFGHANDPCICSLGIREETIRNGMCLYCVYIRATTHCSQIGWQGGCHNNRKC